jgi:hypothetical protein
VNKNILVLLTVLMFGGFLCPKQSRADQDADVLRAEAYIELGDALYALAQQDSDQLSASLTQQGVVVPPGQQLSPGFTYTAAQQTIISNYNAIASQASTAYQEVFGQDFGIQTGTTLNLPINYQYLKRDAYQKYMILKSGFLIGANRRRGANLYAVNADFKKDIIGRTSNLVSELQRLDTEDQRLQQEYNSFQVSQVDAQGDVTGVTASDLQAQNYSTGVQTQIVQYQGQAQSLDSQLSDEETDLEAAEAVVDSSRSVFSTNWSNLLNVQATSTSSPALITVNATQASFAAVPGTFVPGQLLYIQGAGTWKPRGSIDSATFTPFDGVSTNGLLGDCVGGVLATIATVGNNCIVGLLEPLFGSDPNSNLINLNTQYTTAINAMITDALSCDGNGVYVSTSDSVSQSTSSSTSVSAGVSFGFSASISTSVSNSEGESSGQSVTVGMQANNSDLPSANLGALIGQFSGTGLTTAQQQPFYIGISNVIQIPSNATGNVTLSLMQNDIAGHHEHNEGSLQVQISTSTSFASYLPAFWAWFNQSCQSVPNSSQVQNCGFQAIVSNLAYETDPESMAASALSGFLNSYPSNLQPVPAEFQQLLTGAVNASLSTAMANVDYDLALSKYEQTEISKDTATSSLALSQQQMTTTANLINQIQKQQATATTSEALLAVGNQYYEDELANMENMRTYVIARLQRYMGITFDSFNYLYLANAQIKGQAQPGHEGDFYYTQLTGLTDQLSDDDVDNDVSNPNIGYLVYQLSASQLSQLVSSGKTEFSLNPSQFFCQGYGIEDQVRLHIQKVGYLLDIDPLNEQNFFTNPNVRRMAIRTTHGNTNINYDLSGNTIEYYLPSQSKEIYGYSTRVLTDYQSDYTQLGNSDLFQRRSFQNTSYVSDWTMQLENTQSFNLQYLQGVKLVVYFSSVEATNGAQLATCTSGNLGKVVHGHWN